MVFDFVSAGRIVFGAGRAGEAGTLARPFGERCLLIRGRSPGAERVHQSLVEAGLVVAQMSGPGGEPDEMDVDAAVPRTRELRPHIVVAVGGGSVLDFAKAIAALATQPHNAPARDYLEGVGRGLALEAAPLPLVACPTTAGTGSEVTKNAVISSRAGRFKKSLRDARMVPTIALVDPDGQAGAPRVVCVGSGLDALTQNVEAYVSRRATPMTDALALRGIKAASAGLNALVRDDDTGAREPLALAALLSGLALANGGLGAAHGVAQALGIYGVPHGLACAVALPWVLAHNARSGAIPAPRLREIVDALIGGEERTYEAGQTAIAHVWKTTRALGVPRLADLANRYADLPPLDADGVALLAREAQGNSLSGNPLEMDEAALAELLTWMRDADSPEAPGP